MNTVTEPNVAVQVRLAQEASDWLQSRYHTERMREGLRRMLGQMGELREALDRARAACRESESQVERIDANLALGINQSPELKNAEARKAALEVARTSDPERVAAATALERALEARNEASRQLEELEATMKATHLVMAQTTAEMQAVAAIIQLPPF